jgi:ABC-type branched-subunit amino acid transport system substrate-binding protein
LLAGFQTALAAQDHAACEGRYALRLVAIDNATEGAWDATVEAAAANKAASDSTAIGYVASFEPGPLLVSLPILNQAGPMLVVAPMNTYPAFTFPARRAGEPSEYYPNGRRNLVRLGPTDFEAGAAAAQWAAQQGADSVSILYDQYDPTLQGLNVARGFEAEAAALGLRVTASLAVDRYAPEFHSIMDQVLARPGGDWPSLLFYAGPPGDHLRLLFEAKQARLGGAGQLPFLSAPGFAAEAFAQAAGPAAAGTFLLTPALPPDEWPRAAHAFLSLYEGTGDGAPGIEALYGYGAARHLLNSVEAACAAGGQRPTRRAVLQNALARPPAPGRIALDARPVQALPVPQVFALYRVTGGALDFLEKIRAASSGGRPAAPTRAP